MSMGSYEVMGWSGTGEGRTLVRGYSTYLAGLHALLIRLIILKAITFFFSH